MSILIQKPGILSTVQDLGRYGFQRFGINPAGVMDRSAARLINTLIGNKDGEAVIEMHYPAPTIVFEKNIVAAIGGADFSPHLDGRPLHNWQSFEAKAASTLTFAGKASGTRSYLAVRGGFDVDAWLGSKSTHLLIHRGGFAGRQLRAGDRLRPGSRVNHHCSYRVTRISPWILPAYRRSPTIRLLPGAEFDQINEKGRRRLVREAFTLSTMSDRMGLRFLGPPIIRSNAQELLSSAVSFGTVQLLPDGQLIVLMADRQTTGGYPRVAHAISHDLPLLAQLEANDRVDFRMVSVKEAETLTMSFEQQLSFLRVGSKLLTDCSC